MTVGLFLKLCKLFNGKVEHYGRKLMRAMIDAWRLALVDFVGPRQQAEQVWVVTA